MKTPFLARTTLALLLLPALAGPAMAQVESCRDAYRTCAAACRVTGMLNAAAGQQCEAGCGPKLADCNVAARRQAAPGGGAPVPALQRPIPPGMPVTPGNPGSPPPQTPEPLPPVPTLDAPLSTGAVYEAVQAVEKIHKQRADSLLADSLAPAPPECNATAGNRAYSPMACIQARERERERERLARPAQADQRPEIARLLLPLQPSLQLDLQALPAEPVERMLALAALQAKYQDASRLLQRMRGSTRPQGGGLNPLTALIWNFDEPRVQKVKEAQQAPEVQRAWLEGRLSDGHLSLDFLQRIEWNAERQTQDMLKALRAELKGAGLFADRQADLRQSARERDQAGAFANWGQPSDHEIGLALLRVFVVNNGRLSTPFEAERTLPMTVLAAVLNAPVLDVQRVLHVQKTRPCVRSGAGWKCNVQIWLQLFQRGNGMRVWEGQNQNPMIGLILAARAEAMNQNGVPTDIVFRATAQGFEAPELAQRVMEADERTYAAMNAAARAAQRTACLARQRDRWNFLNPNCGP